MMSLDEALISIWQQALIDRARNVRLNGLLFRVRRTPQKHLLQVDFNFDGRAIVGLEQNPETTSRWARLARRGHKVMQFISGGRYIGNVVDGEVTLYRRMAA